MTWNLYATAVCWSVRRAWAALVDLNTSPTDDDLPGVRSIAVGVIGRTSGHGDPAVTVVLDRIRNGHRHTGTINTARDNINSAYWLTRSALRTQPTTPAPVLVQLTHTLPHVDPDTARDAARHLTHADTAIRRWLDLAPDHRPLDGNPPCPTCGTRTLRLWTSPSDRADWTVVCTAPTKPQVVPHIWGGTAAAQLLHPIQAAA